YRGRMIGTVSDLTAFSFYATKTLTAGEGGMVTTDNPVWAERIRLQRLHGIRRTDGAQSHWRYQVVAPGYKYNLTDVQAALALVQLEKCDAHWAARRRIAERYTKAFGDVEGLETPAVPAEREPSWHLYILQLDPARLGFERDFLARALAARGIGTSVHFIPLHLQPYYQRTFGYQTGDYPNAERAYRRCLSLPIYPGLTEEEVERVIAAVLEVVRMHRKSRQVPSSPHAPSTLSEADQKAPAAVAELSRLPDSFYRRTGKRLLDVSLAAAGLLALSPLLALTALLVRLSSPGPILFRQERVGRGGCLLRLLKFRTMKHDAAQAGPDITCAGDGRITPAGSWLRRRKLDELPQLWNVLKGEMSLVGPRPELPRYVAGYTPAQRRVLSVRPGLTDPASVRYHNEEGMLARQSNPEQFYRTVVLPRKLALSLQYLEAMSLANDFRLLGRTLKTVLFQPLPSARRRLSGGVRSNGQGGKTRAVGIDELLKRPPLRPAASDPLARAAYGGKRILVTGAAGSIGSELVRQLAELAPACLLLVDKDENSLHERQLELARHPHPVPLELQVADIRFRTRLARILERFRPQVVFHAAAHKHVPLMEACAAEAVTNNVFATVLLADLALRLGTERFVLVSTDKAVDPESVMGMSKRVAELAVQARAGRQPTRFCCVRFGNVVASRS
ncbi:MAG: DegT/DnrJ/EryC1/StrS family aminotransferase, partial [Terriglobia bacterium]